MKSGFAQLTRFVVAASALWVSSHAALAAEIMPSFDNAPAGWTTDRYQPAGFTDVGTYQGRSDVLGITINSTGDAASRPGGQQGSFYNTQGMQTAVSGGAGSRLSADLYINGSWANAANGYVRTDMWGVMSNGTTVTGYPIIGFTNYGGAARLRAYDGDVAGGWIDLTTLITYDDWTSFAIEFTGTSFDFFINGSLMYSDTTIGGTTGFSAAIMQAYNFADPALGPPTPTTVTYTAHWSNVVGNQVPEPGSLALLAAGLLALGAGRQRARSRS